ncbi:DUF2634 domain-containing protein [Paenibacillus sp. SN-8-1]|uniref:DUF2634 domain-containing protein n=1 Tax=Paenibacillus sp. SN-8-1 TaxID=3435409 RepID=UPI003D9A844A
MALSPLASIDALTDESATTTDEQPLKTYALDVQTGEMGGTVVGIEAIKQFVIKAIRTARFRFAIYDDDYGSELDDLIGQNASVDVLATEIPRVIEEAIIYDDRILDVYGFEIEQEADNLFVSFYVDTTISTIPMEVTI